MKKMKQLGGLLLISLSLMSAAYAADSEYCRTIMLPGDDQGRTFVATWSTEANGDITFTISGVPGDNVAKFRGDGWNDGIVQGLTVNGDPNTGNKYFTRTINTEKTVITLVKQAEPISDGAAIYISGTLEYLTAGNGNAWPTIPFTYTYGSTCAPLEPEPLETPVISSIDAGGVITFTSDPNAGNNVVTVYSGTTNFAMYSQSSVTSGNTINFTTPGTYTVKVQSKSLQFEYTDSEVSDGYTWVISGVYTPPPSEYCRTTIGSGNAACLITWNTEDDGRITVTIAGVPGDDVAKFRDNGWTDERIGQMTVGGNLNTNQTILRRTINAEKTVITLTPQTTIPQGTPIYISQYLEYLTALEGNLYPTVTFNYTYGSKCAPPEPTQLSQPVITGMTGAGVLTFTSDSHTYVGYHVAEVTQGIFALHSQTVTSGNVLNFNLPGTYSVRVRSRSLELDYTDSEWSAPATWTIPGTYTPPASEYCRTTIESGTNECLITWNTETNKTITITIDGLPGDYATAFRNDGWNADRIQQMVIGGNLNTNQAIFERTINAAKTVITLTPKMDVPFGTKITMNQILEYKTALNPDAWPAPAFTYTYGSSCTPVQRVQLTTPVITNIIDGGVITFTADGNAAHHTATVYRATSAYLDYTQTNVTSGGVLAFGTPGTYTVKLQSHTGAYEFLDSDVSSAYTWVIPGTVVPPAVGSSEICRLPVDPSGDGAATGDYQSQDVALFSWETNAAGNLVIKIAPVDEGSTQTAFRNNGMVAANFTVNGQAGVWFGDGTVNAEKTEIVFTPTIPLLTGDRITYNGMIEYKTSDAAAGGLNNLYPVIDFGTYILYTYGTNCSVAPEVTATPTTLAFTPAAGVQTFTLSGKNLLGPVTLTPSGGLGVSPASVAPDANGLITPRPITVTWEEGASAGGRVRITGGGLALPKEVTVTSTGFSEYCNKVLSFVTGGVDYPAYLTIGLSTDRRVLSFTVAPVYGATATWNGNSISNMDNITVNGAAPVGGVSRGTIGSNVITLTFATPLANGNVVQFGGPIVWSTANAEGVWNGNCYINPVQTYTVGLGCDLTSPPPTVRPTVTGVTLEEALAVTAKATVTATNGTYPVAKIRFVEENGKAAILTLDKTADNVYELTGLTPVTSFSFVVSAIDDKGYPSDDFPTRLQFTTTQMPQTIDFPEIPSLRLEDGTYLLTATATSGLSVRYEIADTQIAEVAADGSTLRLKGEGITTITATQSGTTYYAAAEPVVRELRVLSTRVTEFSVAGATFDPQKDYYLMDCGIGQITLTVVTFDPQATLHYGGSEVTSPFTVPIAQSGVYPITYSVGSRDGQFHTDYTITVARPFTTGDVIVQHWDNTLTVINDPAHNGGYHFTGYKWYKNGQYVSNRQWYSAGNKGQVLNPADVYYVELSAEEYDGAVRSCQYTPSAAPVATLTAYAYPNPAGADGKVFVHIDGDREALQGATLIVYSTTGSVVRTVKVTEALTEIQLPLATGIYLLRLQDRDKQPLQTMKVLMP
jgi:hypothetical protein